LSPEATSLHAQAGGLPMRVLHHERLWNRLRRQSRGRCGSISRCGLPQRSGLACHQWRRLTAWCVIPSACREGDTDRQMRKDAQPSASAHSFSAKILAVLVTETKTSGPLGVEGSSGKRRAQSPSGVCSTPRVSPPVRRVYIPKSSGTGKHPLIPCVKDGAIQVIPLA
jgi:hypothetical protein